MVPTVFLSSTFADFGKERSILMEVIPYLDVHLICAERKGYDGLILEKSLKRWIDESDMIILLIGMRYGSESESDYSWTEEEIRYAIKKNKRIFAYVRKLDSEQKMLVDQDMKKAKKFEKFAEMVNKHVPVIPRYSYEKPYQLGAIVVRDVDRYAEELKAKESAEIYSDGFE